MELLLHYCWEHRIYPLKPLQTTDGQPVEVIDPGYHNHDAGPDYFNAKIRIGQEMWVGNVEIHERSRDWYVHGHDKQASYDNCVLHVVTTADRDVVTHDGHTLPQLVLEVPAHIRDNYQELLAEDAYPPCYKIIASLHPVLVHSWMAALQTQRLQEKTDSIAERVSALDGSWEAAYFTTLARNFGFGTNGDAFEQWARNIPLHAVDHHADDLFQIEAIFYGQAGLLNIAGVPERMQLETAADPYFQRMQQEYEYLKHKFQLQPINPRCWRFMRMRPQNFPHIRIAQLARLYHEHRAQLSQILDITTTKQLQDLLRCGVSPYWEEHYTFGHESRKNTKMLSASSMTLLMINTIVPMLFAYGKHMGKEELCERALDLLEQLKPEDNNIVRMWKQVGLPVASAGDSQALIQLKRQYCDRKDCLRCRFGYEYLRGTGQHPYMHEDEAEDN